MTGITLKRPLRTEMLFISIVVPSKSCLQIKRQNKRKVTLNPMSNNRRKTIKRCRYIPLWWVSNFSLKELSIWSVQLLLDIAAHFHPQLWMLARSGAHVPGWYISNDMQSNQDTYIYIKKRKNWWLENIWSKKNLKDRPTRLIF